MAAIVAELRAIADRLHALRSQALANPALAQELIVLSDRLHTLSQRVEEILRSFDRDPRG